MRALVTNDDGVGSPGVATLARAAADLGFDVTVAAPSWDSSGASASLTAVERDGRFLVEKAQIDGVTECFGIEAAPAFITRAAIHEAFGPPPDLVLSGVNRGLNCGHAVLHSGTVGAASTAYLFGLPAIAFSIESSAGEHWDTAAQVARAVLGWFRDHHARVLLNVNVPDVPIARLRGLRAATLAPFGAVTANVTEAGEGYVAMEYRDVDEPAGPGTDVALIDKGFATYTPLTPVCEAHEPSTTALKDLVAASA